MEIVRHELHRRKASSLLIQGVAQATAVHLARHYALLDVNSQSRSPSLPGYRLRQITDWMSRHLADEFNLDQLAAQAGLSKFYFNRLFKNATGVSPSQYHISLRMEKAKRLLRETDKNVLDIAMDVGYANPSHFARLFRRHTGLSPGDHRRQR
jgi:AraC family transcriptional regulator